MTHTIDRPEPPDATDVDAWTLDHDGYGRPFRGTVRGRVSIQGWQHADGRVERSILLDGVELKDPQSTARAILAAHDELLSMVGHTADCVHHIHDEQDDVLPAGICGPDLGIWNQPAGWAVAEAMSELDPATPWCAIRQRAWELQREGMSA